MIGDDDAGDAATTVGFRLRCCDVTDSKDMDARISVSAAIAQRQTVERSRIIYAPESVLSGASDSTDASALE